MNDKVETVSEGNLPDFLIIGAQKSGTSTLSYNLNLHPEIIRSRKKELHYFDRMIDQGHSLEWYKQHFKSEEGKKVLFFEATPSYLPQLDIPSKVAKVMPDIKLIVILRNPVNRALSAYNMNLKNKSQVKTLSFREVIKTNIRRYHKALSIESIYSTKPRLFRNLVGRGLYAEQLKNWHKFFNKEQFLIIGFNDLVDKPEEVFNQIYNFLGVSELDFDALGYVPRNKGEYQISISNSEREMLREFYEKPNKELVDLLGYEINW